MIELFTLAGLCGVTFYNVLGYTFSCCGKVNCCVNGRNMIGYVISERGDKWTVKFANNKVGDISRVYYNTDVGKYRYPECVSSRRSYITQYWPIRFLVNKNGKCRFTLNRYTYDNKCMIIPQLSR